MDSNLVIEKEKPFIDRISNEFHYDSNIRHLLYIIIPAFIIKYGINREKLILNTFKDIMIISSSKESKIIRAYYSSSPRYVNGDYKTKKHMVIQNYNQIGLVELLDNLVHEFNHAVNSYNNEINFNEKELFLRTGLTFRVYNKKDLSFIRKDKSFILEEIINTRQTEEIINIIKNFKPTDSEISNTIYAINSETKPSYNSKSYYLQSHICKQILENRTFISTLEGLRLTGDIYDIDRWFDDIIGKKDSYQELINLLNDIYNLEIEYTKKKYFKSFTVNKIKDLTRQIMYIIETFNDNVVFK